YWKHDTRCELSSTPLIADGKILISADGEIIILTLARDKIVLGSVDMEEISHTAPIFANAVLFLATRNTLFAIAGTKEQPPRPQGNDWPQFGRDQTRNAVSPENNPPTWWQMEERAANGEIIKPAQNVL